MIQFIWHSGKSKTIDRVKKLSSCQGLRRRVNTGSLGTFQGSGNSLFGTIIVHTWHCVCQNPRNLAARRANLNVRELKRSLRRSGTPAPQCWDGNWQQGRRLGWFMGINQNWRQQYELMSGVAQCRYRCYIEETIYIYTHAHSKYTHS